MNLIKCWVQQALDVILALCDTPRCICNRQVWGDSTTTLPTAILHDVLSTNSRLPLHNHTSTWHWKLWSLQWRNEACNCLSPPHLQPLTGKYLCLFFQALIVSLTCPLCPQLDSALHILSGCQHTNKSSLACSMVFKAISKTGSLGFCFVCKDTGSS